MSSGQRQKFNIARSLLHDPPIYIMDEPTLGLDIESLAGILDFIVYQRSRAKTLLIVTHNMEMVHKLGGQVAFLVNGRILHNLSVTEIMQMFGGIEKNAIQVAADESFIEDVVKAVGGREKGSEEFVKKGWAAFFDKHDPATAMMKFNQAWLLNPENPDVLWGFGVLSGTMNNIDNSVKFLRQAAEKLTNNARVQADLGFSLTIFAEQSDDVKVAAEIIAEAFACFAKAEKLESDYEPLFSNWAVALFLNKDYTGAWEKIIKAEKLGGKTLNPMFIKDLESKMPRSGN